MAGPGSSFYWLALSGLIVWGLPAGTAWVKWRDGGLGALPFFHGAALAFVSGMLFFISLKMLAGTGRSEFLYFNF
jgi:hypothetical protein